MSTGRGDTLCRRGATHGAERFEAQPSKTRRRWPRNARCTQSCSLSGKQSRYRAGATTPQQVLRAELVQWIRDAGRIPVERDTIYNVLWSADEALAPVGETAPVATV